MAGEGARAAAAASITGGRAALSPNTLATYRGNLTAASRVGVPTVSPTP